MCRILRSTSQSRSLDDVQNEIIAKKKKTTSIERTCFQEEISNAMWRNDIRNRNYAFRVIFKKH